MVSAFDSDRTEVFGSGSDQWIVSDAGDAEKVARTSRTASARPALNVTYAAARGKPAEALIDEAERIRRPDDRGRQPADAAESAGCLGSVANSVAHNAPCDVYIAKTDAD